jgi:two-component system, response regulator PdtaR
MVYVAMVGRVVSLIYSMPAGRWNVTPQRALATMIVEKIVPVILVVEDEALVRLAAVGMLEDAGFRMVEAANGEQAIELLAADSDVQLLFTDVTMPGAIDGIALARQVRDRWPHIAIMVVSAKRVPQSEELPAGSRFELKPYSPETVVRHARELTSA